MQTARNQTDAAIAAFTETLRLNPRASGAQVALSRLHLAAGKAERVGRLCAGGGDRESRRIRRRAWRSLERSLAKGDLKQADVELSKLALAYPDVAAVRVQKGILLGLQARSGARAEFEARAQVRSEFG